jgi:hypothetical protein
MRSSALPLKRHTGHSISEWLARRIWFAMLWWMRRPWLKRIRRTLPFIPEHKRAEAWRRIKAQDAWARKHGLSIVTVAVNVMLASLLFTSAYMALLTLTERGLLGPMVR